MKRNVIFIMNDSLRRDHVNAYGDPAPWPRLGREGEPFIRTPNLDRLAQSSALFDRAYIASYPTVPNRTDLITGRYGFTTRGWQPLEPEDVILPEVVKPHGYTSALMFDTPPMGADDYNFTRGFDAWFWARGQHADRYITDPRIPTPVPADRHKVRGWDATKRYLRNQAERRYERDYIAPRTISAAMDWLEDNATRDGFVLWVDTWDPHEPFDPPPHYLRMYAEPGYDGQALIYPEYGRGEYMTDAERNHVRALYAGEVTMVDTWVGYLLDTVERLGLLDNTLIIHTSDHGHLFGDHDLQGKPGGQLGTLFEPTTRIPLMVRHPDGLGAGQRIAPIVQPPDILPTVLDFLGVPIPPSVQGGSILPLLRGEEERLRERAFSGRYPQGPFYAPLARAFDGFAGADRVTEPLTVTTEEWALICAPAPWPSRLYNLTQDPGQTRNVIDAYPEVAGDLNRDLIAFLESYGSPADYVAKFRWPPATTGAAATEGDVALFTIRDRTGRRIAFPTRAEAETCVIPGATEPAVEETTLHALTREDPRALVHIYGQYYRAEELA